MIQVSTVNKGLPAKMQAYLKAVLEHKVAQQL
jgi:hypothetical protein